MDVIRFINSEYKYGYHITKYPSITDTFLKIAKNTPLTAVQVYISSPKSKAPPKFDFDDLQGALKVIKKYDLTVVIHGCLLYNLAGTTNGKKDDNYESSLNSTKIALSSELDYGVLINAPVIIHPGSQKDTQEGLKQIAKSIEIVLTRETLESEKIAKILKITPKEVIKKRKIIIENAAGEGTKLCSTLEEITQVINLIDINLRPQIGVCIDTAHSYGRGLYDWGIKGEIEKFYDDFDRIIDLKYLYMFHFNDSKVPFGSRKDRHEQLGCGYIFGSDERLPQITTFMLEAKKRNLVIIGEPPINGEFDYELVGELLKNTEYPLFESFNIKQKI